MTIQEISFQKVDKHLLLRAATVNELHTGIRSMHLTPGYVTGILGCADCPAFGVKIGGAPTQPRISNGSNAISTTLNCNNIEDPSVPCFHRFDSETAIAIATPDTDTHHARSVEIKLTDICQMRCKHCANDEGPKGKRLASLEHVYDIMDKFKPKSVTNTGGEPSTVFDLFLNAVRIEKQFTDHITVNTNLELLTPEKILQMEQAGVSHIHSAIFTLDEDLHKKIRGNKMARLEKVLRHIEFIMEYTKLNFVAEFIPMESNFQHFPAVYNYVLGLREKYGERIIELEVGKLIPVGRGKHERILTAQDLLPVFTTIGRPGMKVEVFCFGKKDSAEFAKQGFTVFPCDAGKGLGLFYVGMNGEVVFDNFSGVKIADHYSDFDPSVFRQNGRDCPFRD